MRKEVTGVQSKARLLVVDDYPLIREGLKCLLALQSDLEWCGEADTFAIASDLISIKKPDLVLLEIRLGSSDGLEFIKALKAKNPKQRILVVSQLEETVYAERSLRAGAQGFVMKKQPIAELLSAIRSVLGGHLYVGQRLAAIALHKMLGQRPVHEKVKNDGVDKLTDRELQVFHLLGAQLPMRKIAAELKLSVKTVETHRENIKHKLDFSSAAELAKHASQWIHRHGDFSVPNHAI